MSLALDDPRHGMYSTYVNHRCRCDACRAANTVAVLAQRKRRREVLAPDDERHGLYSTYANHSCRCSECRAANAEYRRGQVARYRLRAGGGA